MDYFQQLLGNPNPLQALLQAPQMLQPPGQDAEAFTRLPSLPMLQQGAGAAGPLGALATALGGLQGGGGAQPMDEVPRGYQGDDAPAHDEDAPSPRDEVAGVDRAANATPDILAGMGPDLQAGMGLGDQPGADDQYTIGGPSTAPPGLVPAAQAASYAKLHPRPVAPELDERSLYPGTKRNILQGVIPGIAALVAGLTGGKEAAAAVMLGAHAGNQQYNQELKERGLLHYRQQQQRYARDTQSWQDDRQEAEQHAQIIAQLAEKARGMKPEDAKAWLQSQVKIYAPLGINPLEALDASQVGADDKRKADIREKVNARIQWHITQARAKDPNATIDLQSIIDSESMRIDGVTKPMRQWMDIGDMPNMDLPAGASISATRRAVNAEVADLEDSYKQSTGADHIEPAMHTKFVKDAWAAQEQTKENKRALEAATLAHLQASTAAAKAQAWRSMHPMAGMQQGPTRQQDAFAKARIAELARNPMYTSFVKQSGIYQSFLTTYNNLKNSKEPPTALDDQTLMAEFIRAKHPNVNVITEADALRMEAAHPGYEVLKYGYKKVVNGTTLDQWQRDKMLEILKANYEGQKRATQVLYDHLGKQLESRQLDPNMYLQEGLGVYEDPLEGYWTKAQRLAMEAEDKKANEGFEASERAAGIKPAPKDDRVVNPLGTRGAAPASPGAAPASPPPERSVPDRVLHPGPRLNEERLINGQRARWDGKGWVAF